MKKLYYLLFAFILICLGCKKDKKEGPPADTSVGLHILITAGNNQKDTIGKGLKDSVTIKVINNNVPVSGYIVQFKRSGCEDQTISQKTTNASGTASFAWYLSGETGPQSLKAILLDNSHAIKDSVTFGATGIAPSHGWHRGGCLQNFPIGDVAALSSGRILASVNATGFPYFSDDNAVSWHPLKTFSNTYFISKIMSVSTGTYIATQNDGVFFSADNGQTWANITGGIPDTRNFSDLAYTPAGNLIFCGSGGVYLSTDNGTSWNEYDFGLPAGQATYPCEQTNGDLYIIGSDAYLYYLPVHKSQWVNIGAYDQYLLSSVESIYIDSKGAMFIGTPHNAPDATATLYESVDQAQSWSPVFSQIHESSSYPNISGITQYNGVYYFSFAGIGVYQTSNFVNYNDITAQFGNLGLLSFTVSKNSTFVLGSPGFGVYYKVP
ncbi:MAG: WD40/YVTN/BNR-like repeat-containing protein [Sphingobacteriales bacterium]